MLRLYQITTMSRIRAFIACEIPETVIDRISEIQDELEKLGADVSWTKTSGIHITLRFLGDIEEDYIDKTAAVIEKASKGQPPFEISIKGSGAFPNLKNPRVIWLGIEDETKGLLRLQQPLEDGLKALGFEPEEREFRPHLTLGRVKSSKGRERLSLAVSGLKDMGIGSSFIVDRVMLYKSELRPTGAVYTRLKEIMLM